MVVMVRNPGDGQTGARPVEGVLDVVCAIWCEVLGLESVSEDDDFFLLGGHSLLVVEVADRIAEAIGVDEVPLEDIFERPTPREIAELVSTLAPRTG